ncbi:NAD(P)/FAD-dependent oxidoreductase [Gordonia sp. SCSIO 19800]|uniref:flavin-containing monooxygenase n=1 Tax=Gordonia sp. SCSIO 19800 TaxID=2826926 RepID=UPI001B8399C3|nr:NAD(P)/FAD-dependent oxidoreductase [Gordonia sp. SCSIO 19800]MBR7194676.1 NAD(P)/FAD-dependent oxidoreductase [Gordonia sp. SCSIO 19800]
MSNTTLDAVVIGAGVGGIYQTYQLKQAGLNVRAYDAGSDVGGTWHWNRYPGARFDSEGYIYQYLFDEDLYKGWSWSQKFPGRDEIVQWFAYAMDKMGVRDDYSFNTTIESAEYNDETGRWTVRTDQGEVIDTQFLVSCAGMLSAPLTNLFDGQDDFTGQIFHTSRWPAEKVELAGKRVAVIGTGATGIQVIQTIAPEVEQLKVFIRSPQFTLPMKNPDYTAEDVAEYHSRYEQTRDTVGTTVAGFAYDFTKDFDDLAPEDREAYLEELYADGSLKLWLASFLSMFFDEEVSKFVSSFVRAKIEARLQHDPRLIELLVPGPDDFGFGTHRVPLERGYYEAYLRPNVEAIGVADNPIRRIVPEGIRLADGTVHEVDVILMATGFDAGSGALSRLDPKGRNGRSLAEQWNREISTTYGLAIHGYPNLLATGIPLAPAAALCNMPTCLQQQTEWITGLITHMRDEGHRIVEPTAEGEAAWVEQHDAVTQATLLAKTNSWWNGANVPGKPHGRVLSYLGVGDFAERTEKEAANGYSSFQFS